MPTLSELCIAYMDLLEQLEVFVDRHGLLPNDARVIVALSGGVDSVALAHLLRRRGQPMALAHANFQLRGAESEEDEAFVRAIAAEWALPIYIRRFDTRAYAQEHRLSIQVAARQLRYEWLESLCDAEGWTHIATAHQLNDSVETALFHWARGTGLSGLSGIPLRSGRVVRPLLWAKRAEIVAYATAQGLRWREDSSNADLHYTRNALRHRVVAALEEIFPDFIAQAGKTLQHLRTADANIQHLLRQLATTPEADGVLRIERAAIEALPEPADALFELVHPYGFTPEQAQQMMLCRYTPGKEWQSKSGHRLVVGRDSWLLTESTAPQAWVHIHADDLMVRLPDDSRLFLMEVPLGTPLPTDPTAVVVDAQQVRFPLTLRRWHPGDAFQPLGMGGKSQKLQDFFTNHKLSALDKERIWVLENGDGQILWVVGMRLAEPFKVKQETFKLLKFTWIK